MAGSSFGELFRITTWGESHGPAIGVTIDGCPAGLKLVSDDIQNIVNERVPKDWVTSSRKEPDIVRILSGVFEDTTTGTPISILIENEDVRSDDYKTLRNVNRPGHGDFTYSAKYGIRDYRGGGRSSGRETVARVAAGAVAELILRELGIFVNASIKSIAGIEVDSPENEKSAKAYVEKMASKGDSCGGCIRCTVKNVPAGLGEPVFDKLDAMISHGIMSIGAIKAVEIGDGVKVATSVGSANNDMFCGETNHAGGIEGGISNGRDIVVRAYVKPTPSIASTVPGRHDPCIVPKAVAVVKAMVAITLVDALLRNSNARLENIKKIYEG